MAAQANIVANDGADTPVTHTFVPETSFRDKDGTLTSTWKENVATVPDEAQPRVTIKKRKLVSGVTRVSVRVEVPVMEAINAQNSSGYTAAPKVAYTDTTEIVGHYHSRSTIASRRLASRLALNVAQGYTGTFSRMVAGPGPEVLDQLIMAS